MEKQLQGCWLLSVPCRKSQVELSDPKGSVLYSTKQWGHQVLVTHPPSALTATCDYPAGLKSCPCSSEIPASQCCGQPNLWTLTPKEAT